MVEVQEGEWDWSGAETLWPPMTSWLDWELPAAVRDCLDEAQRCFKAKAFSAGAVMVGLALEAISVGAHRRKVFSAVGFAPCATAG